LALLVVSLATPIGCAGKKSDRDLAKVQRSDAQKILDASRQAATAAMKEKNKGKIKAMTLEGQALAEKCAGIDPQNAGCYYWHAVNIGLYYQARVIGYQTGIKKMLADCDKVIALDPGYDHAGAYRMRGQIYTKLPQTGGSVDSVTRDLELAEENLRKAVELAPDYPENHLALAEVLLDKKDTKGALAALTSAKGLAPGWKSDVSYGDWTKDMKGLEKKLSRKTK
jgi:tetratricopeptide (TPR) repeat protein